MTTMADIRTSVKDLDRHVSPRFVDGAADTAAATAVADAAAAVDAAADIAIDHDTAADRRIIRQQRLTGERAMFEAAHACVIDSIFADGESPLKHAHDIALLGSSFQWKYPLWYARDIVAKDCTWFEMARAGVWYTHTITVENAIIEAPKNFRRSTGVTLTKVTMPNAAETLWHCRDVELDHVTANGDYFAMNCENMTVRDFRLTGDYPFDGVRNVEIHNARMLSKDAFWNSENVTIYDSFISGEYLGWNSKNLTLVNCTIESLQGMCYIDNLTLKHCRLLNTTLAFEYSTVDVDAEGRIDSVLNPSGGVIRAAEIGELAVDPKQVDPARTRIILGETAGMPPVGGVSEVDEAGEAGKASEASEVGGSGKAGVAGEAVPADSGPAVDTAGGAR